VSGFESVVEEAAIAYFKALGYDYRSGLDIAPDGPNPERENYQAVILEGRLRAALARVNPHLGADALEDAARKVLRPESPSLS